MKTRFWEKALTKLKMIVKKKSMKQCQCEEGLKNLTDSVNTHTEAKLNEVRQERVSTVSMV